MKIKDELVLQNIAGKWIVINTNAASPSFNKVLVLNASGKLLWEKLEQGAEPDTLAAVLTGHYGIDPQTAQRDADAFVQALIDVEGIE